ncbi:hypothetical protein [Sphingomonas oryzagri]
MSIARQGETLKRTAKTMDAAERFVPGFPASRRPNVNVGAIIEDAGWQAASG